MDTLLQRFEVQAVVSGDDNLAVNDAAFRELCLDRRDELGEVAGHRPLIATAQLDLISVAKAYGPESIPFGLIRCARRDRPNRLGQHR